MSATGFKYKCVLIGIIFIISAFLSGRLTAQMTFHLAGPFSYQQNLNMELHLAEKRNKIPTHIFATCIRQPVKNDPAKNSTEANIPGKEISIEGKNNEEFSSAGQDTIQKIRLAQLKRNTGEFKRKTVN
jgi:hypothetical protein